MPSTITHSYFAKDLYDILPEEISSKVDLKRIKMFAQSSDSLMFYNLCIPSSKKIRKIHSKLHTSNTNLFFNNLLNFVKVHNINDSDTYSFIIGFISHYVLDSTIHPYIIFKTGIFNKKIKNTYKYNNIHYFMETFIDNDMIKRRDNTNPYKFNFNTIFDKRKFSNELDDVIDYTFYSTFKVRDMGDKYYKSLRQMKRFLNTYRKDPYGIKKVFYKLLDTFTPKSVFRFEALSYYYPLEDKHNFLNNDHNTWNNPADNTITSDESFVDLYIKSIEEARYIIIKVFDYLNGEDIDLDELFKNKSYVSGLNCDLEQELKYFEF